VAIMPNWPIMAALIGVSKMTELETKDYDFFANHMSAIANRNINCGVMFKAGNDKECIYTVIDILTTYNLKNEIVKTEYLCTHKFLGQIVKSRHGKTQILMGLISSDEALQAIKNSN
jgi:hypothetical protein